MVFPLEFEKTKEGLFWAWVSKNAKALSSLTSGYDPVYVEANERLKAYSSELVFEVWGNKFVISADGNYDCFQDVIKLCQAAPQTDEYEVIAFRPARGFLDLKFDDHDVRQKDVYFKYEIHEGKLDLEIYHPDYTDKFKKIIAGAIFIMLDHGIGEYLVETKLRYIDIFQLEGQKGLRPIQDLKEILEEI